MEQTNIRSKIMRDPLSSACGLIILVVWLLRQSSWHFPEPFRFFLGIGPNLFATPIVMFYLLPYVQRSTRLQANTYPAQFLNLFFALLALALWEYLQWHFAKHPMDGYDMIASAASGIIYSAYMVTKKENEAKSAR